MLRGFRRPGALGACALLASGVLATAPALANGRFPAADQLVVDPLDQDHLALRTTFGLLTSRDRGESWLHTCEQALGYMDIDPGLAVLPGGRVLFGLPTGVSRGDETGCTFAPAEGIDGLVVDVSASRGEPGTAIALTVSGTESQLFESSDDGGTFSAVGGPLVDFIAQTLDVSPSDPRVVYLSGRTGKTGVLLRSDDHGTSFASFAIPGADSTHQPYIAAIDPLDAERVYLRLFGLPGRVVVTPDGGESFEILLELSAPASGFALSEDGSTIWVTNTVDGTFRGTRNGGPLERVACRGLACLASVGGELFGCGDNAVDGFMIGGSADAGKTFEPLLDMSCVTGPALCDPNTGVGSICPNAWPAIRDQLGATTCNPSVPPPLDASCLSEGGAGADVDAGAGGEPPSLGGAGAPSASGRGADATGNDDGGCSVRASTSKRPVDGGFLCAVVLLIFARRMGRSVRQR
jgi:hypothetical protein